jgi:hypothetical protein
VIHITSSFSVDVIVNAAKEEWLVTNGELVESGESRAHDNVTLNEVSCATHVRYRSIVTHCHGLFTHVFKRDESKV